MKNVIIFGNGLVSKDLNLAHRVDNTDEFDLVVRMNECKILPFHDRIGWRTDVYTFCARQTMVDMHGMCKEIWWWQSKKQMKILLSEDNPSNIIAGYKALENKGVKHNHIYKTDKSLRNAYSQKRLNLKKALGEPKNLSCGISVLLACEMFLGHSNFKVNLAGYDGGVSGHLWGERARAGLGERPPCPKCNYTTPKFHFFDKEHEWLKRQEQEGVINIIR